MTEEQILEGNKFIAEFMGGKYVTDMSSHKYGGFMEFDNPDRLYFCDSTKLKYHISWDWLFQAVEKIIKDFATDYNVEHNMKYSNKYWATIGSDGGYYSKGISEVSLIEATWLAVVEFVKWYNNQIQK